MKNNKSKLSKDKQLMLDGYKDLIQQYEFLDDINLSKLKKTAEDINTMYCLAREYLADLKYLNFLIDYIVQLREEVNEPTDRILKIFLTSRDNEDYPIDHPIYENDIKDLNKVEFHPLYLSFEEVAPYILCQINGSLEELATNLEGESERFVNIAKDLGFAIEEWKFYAFNKKCKNNNEVQQ